MAEIKLIFGLICEDVRFEVNGKITIVGEGNLINLPQLPLTLPLCILTKWSGSPAAKGIVTLQMQTPDSAVPVELSTQELELGSNDLDTCYGGTVNKIPWQVHSTGVHTILVLLDQKLAGKIEIVIKKPQFLN